MRLVAEKIFFFFLVLILFAENVFATDVLCEYPDEKLTLTYTDGRGMPAAEYKNWSDDDWTVNILLVKLGEKKYIGNEIEIADELYQAQGATCPTRMYICEYTTLSLGCPNIRDLAEWILGIVTALGGLFSDGLADFSTDMFEAADGIVIDQAKLFIMNREAYENNEYREYEGGSWGWTVADNYADRYNDADWMWPGFRQILGGLWSAAAGSIQNLWENTLGDDPGKVYYRNFSCKKVDYVGENATIDVNCNAVLTRLYAYDTAISNYKSCSDEKCKAEKVKQLNLEEKRIKSLCNNVLKNYTYNEAQTDCLNVCMNIGKTLNQKKSGTDLYKEPDTNHSGCSISSRLVDWILKIINWLRYIVPVLLIILSILDFIKAIASDSEDEVKKVTSKFTKRLALEFLLGIFGIDTNNFCL